MVLVTQGVLARQGFVRQPAIMYTLEVLQKGQGLERFTATLGVTTHPRQCVGDQYMQPVQFLGHPDPGLIGLSEGCIN